jgi:hypothetical protein
MLICGGFPSNPILSSPRRTILVDLLYICVTCGMGCVTHSEIVSKQPCSGSGCDCIAR